MRGVSMRTSKELEAELSRVAVEAQKNE